MAKKEKTAKEKRWDELGINGGTASKPAKKLNEEKDKK